jgi:3-polyprenyl-4-hydroxybenzoate decarboxylase
LGIDATRKVAGEEVGGIALDGVLGRDIRTDRVVDVPRGVHRVFEAYEPAFGRGRCALVQLDKGQRGRGRRLLEQFLDAIAGTDGSLPWDFVLLTDDEADLRDVDAVLFRWCANSDPGRDLIRRGTCIAFDATTKPAGTAINGHPVRDFPPVLMMDEEIEARVTRRWSEYGFAE